jgi:D-alanyl-D-alanine carboxypeptidase/D-alanyl-D-alanine-endopeptidase (penicillin-binding protein 4)
MGISSIEGDIIGDESYFQTNRLGYGWQWDDEPFWYSAQISALTFNDNCIDVSVHAADNAGDPPSVTLSPPTAYFKIINEAVTTKSDSIRTLYLSRQRMKNVLLVQNEIPKNKPRYFESISVDDPARYFIFVLKEVLESKGIKVKGSVKTSSEKNQIQYQEFLPLFTHYSPPLSEIITVINKRSQNLYAEQLLITLAAEYGNKAAAEAGADVVNETLAAMGISTDEFLMHDGSGLSRVNLISPNTVGLLLRYMSNHKFFPYFFDSLPIGGIDGTLRRRMLGMPAQGRVHAKTGYVGHVRNLSGYVISKDDETFVFSILVNNYLIPTSAINLLQDQICTVLANFSRS